MDISNTLIIQWGKAVSTQAAGNTYFPTSFISDYICTVTPTGSSASFPQHSHTITTDTQAWKHALTFAIYYNNEFISSGSGVWFEYIAIGY